MDKVRLGRVLGKATRLAARTAMEAAEAATAADPRAGSPGGGSAGSTAPRTDPRRQPAVLRPTAAAAGAAASAAGSQVRRGVAGMRAGTLPALREASRALWLEVTGSFFALFALVFAAAAWRLRGYLHSAVPQDHWRFAAICVVCCLFGWFAVSSFLSARRRA